MSRALLLGLQPMLATPRLSRWIVSATLAVCPRLNSGSSGGHDGEPAASFKQRLREVTSRERETRMEDSKEIGTFQSLLSVFLSLYRCCSVDTIVTTYVEENSGRFRPL